VISQLTKDKRCRISTADVVNFVNTTINKYKQGFNDGKFDRVEGSGRLDCYESDGTTEVVAKLSLKH
jgi:hypothetical protein